MPKIVYSRTLQNADWNTTIVREVDASAVRALKEQPGADLVLGGADLADEFLRQGLLDGMRLYVHPVLVGQGTRLFRDGVQAEFALEQTRTFGNGVVMLHYGR
jgi:dihydrofolate reductase